MQQKTKNQPAFMNIGLSSLMVVFLTLCLVTFAMLTLASSKSDLNLSEKLAERKSAYYQASSLAEEKLAALDQVLSETYEASPDTYLSSLEAQLAKTEYTLHTDGDDTAITYEVPLDDDQFLCVKLTLNDPVTSEYYYGIASWQIQAQTEWTEDNHLNLIQIP